MATTAYTSMQQTIENGLYNVWVERSNKATQQGEESKDPLPIIRQMAKDVADIVAGAIETYVAAGNVIVSGANISGSNGAGAVAFSPLDPAKMTHV